MPSLSRSLPPALALASALLSSGLGGAVPSAAPPIEIRRSAGPIEVDGDLSDPGWAGATRIESFFETSPGDNLPPSVETVALIAFDRTYFYVGLICSDPEPSKIRAPYVDRDNIADSDDHVTVFLDTRGDRRSATEFRVNPRGQQSDGTYEDANQTEDLSPDVFYDSASRIDAAGWTAEVRIPFSSLRYDPDARTWGILVERNYPRSFRRTIFNAPIPRNSNCLICHSTPLTGLSDLPRGGHFVAAPDATLSESAAPRAGDPSSLKNRPARGNGGIDFKWTPTAGTAVDGAINPDFSQVESDAGQISVNNRFALFFSPEKRPFFLEGVDLLQTPLPVVSTRTITSPRWGLRATGKSDESSYTVLVAEDRGGGTVVVPGPTASEVAPQDGSSIAAIGRLRRDFGGSFAGLLVTDRENSPAAGGGHNRVIGADFQWRDADDDKLTGQFLASDTRTPNRPDIFPAWDGRGFSSRAFSIEWSHNDPRWHLRALHQDFGDGFRADDGYIPQVGYRHEKIVAAYSVYDLGLLSQLQSGIFCDYFARPSGALIQRQCGFYASPGGVRNLGGEIDLTLREKDRVGATVVDSRWLLQVYGLSIDPGRIFSRISLSGFLGDSPDIVNARPGRGGEISLTATVKPTLHLQLDFSGDRQWLDVDSNGLRRRLFTAHIERLKATYNFSARCFVRAIAQYFAADRDISLYTPTVSARQSSFSGSALFAYRWNWQTVAFLGYGDDREGDAFGRLRPTDRSLFLKLSYAFQR